MFSLAGISVTVCRDVHAVTLINIAASNSKIISKEIVLQKSVNIGIDNNVNW